MPRNYKRKTEKCQWTVEVLQRAIEATENGLSIRRAGSLYGIPATTLRDRKKVQNYLTPRLGKYPVFNIEREKALAQEILSLSKVFHRLTTIIIRLVAFEFAEINNIPHRFNSRKKLAGKDWADSFLRRNPRLRNFLDERNSASELMNDDKRFVSNFLKAMSKYRFTENRIFNVNDLQMFPKKKLVEKLVPALLGNGNNVTVVCAANAWGQFIPPMVIFPKSPKGKMEENVEQNDSVGANYRYSIKGVLTEELFLDWLICFNKKVNITTDDPVLLLLDNQKCHITLKIYNYCKYNNIILVSAPAHSSVTRLPLQITFVDSLKEVFARECYMFSKSNPNIKIAYSHFALIFSKAYLEVATKGSVISGFHQSGIFPVDKEKLQVDETMDDSSTDDEDSEPEIKEEEPSQEESVQEKESFQKESDIDIKLELLGDPLVKEEFDIDTYEDIAFTFQGRLGIISNQSSIQTNPSDLPSTSSNIECTNILEEPEPGIRPKLCSKQETTTVKSANTSKNTTEEAKCRKRKLQEECPTPRINLNSTNESNVISKENVCDEEMISEESFNIGQPSQPPPVQHSSSSLGQDPNRPNSTVTVATVTSTDSLVHRYTNLLDNPLMDDLSIDKNQLKTFLDQLDATSSQNCSPVSEVPQTEICNNGTNLKSFFNYILKIVETLGTRDQAIFQKRVANLALDMKINQLQS